MKTLHIQIQPELAPLLDISETKKLFESIAYHPLALRFRFNEGFDNGAYINFDFGTEDLAGLWSDVSHKIYKESLLAEALLQSSIATCEGEKGWDDYLLLHHFDPSVELETL